MFVALAAVDLGGKCNFELTFPIVPTITELRERVVSVCTAESAIRRPAAPLFEFHRAQVFDERMDMWVDLVASSQLEDYCQLYIFQKESPWHKDTPGRIPPPIRPCLHASHPAGVAATPQRPSLSPAPAAAQHPGFSPVRERAASGSVAGYGSVAPLPPPPQPQSVVPAYAEAAAAAALAEVPAGHVPYADKVRGAYDEMDTMRQRAVSLEDWKAAFERLRLTSVSGLTEETVLDLFAKADRDQDGIVSYVEFQVFAEVYPKMVDSLHFRARRHKHEVVRKQRLESQEDLLTTFEKRCEDACTASLDAEAAGSAGQDKVAAADVDADCAKEEEEAAAASRHEAARRSEELRTSLKEAKTGQAQAREAYKRVELQKKHAERAAQTQQQKLRQAEAERDRAAKELERLRRLVEEQERELDRREAAITDAEAVVDEARRTADAAGDPELEARREAADDEAARAEQELRGAVEAEAELAKEHKAKQREAQAARAAREAVAREAEEAAALVAVRKEDEERAQRQLEAHRTVVEELRASEEEGEMKRFEEEEKENELVQMEVRLREQREAVEKKEAALRSAHMSFTEETGRVSPRSRNHL